MAAVAAVGKGKAVTVYEKMNRPGIKLALAGGGRCNISNTGDLLAGLHHSRFLLPALSNLDNGELVNLLARMGVESIVDECGRVYPREMNGMEFAAHLRSWLEGKGVRFQFNAPLTGLRVEDGVLQAVEVGGRSVKCTSVIIACGGNTWPKTGSDGGVAAILQKLGHTITPLLPALAPVKTREEWPTQLKGLSIKDVAVAIAGNGKKLEETRGDLLFTHFGLSGPVILDASHAAAKALHQKQTTHTIIDLLPNMGIEQIRAILERERQKTLANALACILPQQLAKTLGNDQYIKGLAPSTLAKSARGLKETRLEIVDVLGKNHAMVCQGGVSLREINPRTMESRLIRGLFIAGEIMDYHGKTGGYNLHAAFATGWLAGDRA